MLLKSGRPAELAERILKIESGDIEDEDEVEEAGEVIDDDEEDNDDDEDEPPRGAFRRK